MLSTDPIDLALDADGDLDVATGLTRGLAAVVQGCRVRLSMFRGEWFLDLSAGVPYLPRDGVSEAEAILGQRFNDTKARAAFRQALLATPGVVAVLQLDLDFQTGERRLTATWRVRTEFGDSPVEVLAM